jgi:Bardet-Biedl syndrome 1 protein
MSFSAAIKHLLDARDRGTILSARSCELLSLTSDQERLVFITSMKEITYIQSTLITCLDVLKKDNDELDAVTLLIVGNEAGQLLILPQDPLNSNVLCKLQLPSVPALLSVSGTFDVEWRVNIVCRDGKMYSVKNGDVRGSALLVGTAVDLGSQAVAIVRQEKLLWIATMDRYIACYSARGKRLKGMHASEDVAELCVMSLRKAKVNYLLLVALVSGEICMYRELTMIHSFKLDRPVIAMCYGLYGREENSLVLVHGPGALSIKMWRRTAEIDSLNFTAGPPPEQDVPLPVPKKTKLYVEQTQVEQHVLA